MSFIHMPPKFLSPYSGTELGSAGNVFCTQIASASFIDGGAGFVLASSAAYKATPGGAWGDTDVETVTLAPTTTTLATGSTGAGLTASFSVTGQGATVNPSNITVTIVNPGSGYIVGDILVWSNADVKDALDALTSLAMTIGGGDAPLTHTVTAADTGGVVTTVKAGQNGWQFSVNSIEALTQLVTITIPDNGIAGDDFADQDYLIVANITGGVAETATTTVGTITGSIFHHSDTNTDQITLRRVTGSAASTLLAGEVTVRLVKRQLSTA